MSELTTNRATGTVVQATTPQLVFTIAGVNLTGCKVKVYIRRKNTVLIAVSGDRLTVVGDSTGTTLTVRLTQEETLSMAEGDSEVQAHWIDSNGVADATYPPVHLQIGKILYPHVIEYGG